MENNITEKYVTINELVKSQEKDLTKKVKIGEVVYLIQDTLEFGGDMLFIDVEKIKLLGKYSFIPEHYEDSETIEYYFENENVKWSRTLNGILNESKKHGFKYGYIRFSHDYFNEIWGIIMYKDKDLADERYRRWRKAATNKYYCLFSEDSAKTNNKELANILNTIFKKVYCE